MAVWGECLKWASVYGYRCLGLKGWEQLEPCNGLETEVMELSQRLEGSSPASSNARLDIVLPCPCLQNTVPTFLAPRRVSNLLHVLRGLERSMHCVNQQLLQMCMTSVQKEAVS